MGTSLLPPGSRTQGAGPSLRAARAVPRGAAGHTPRRRVRRAEPWRRDRYGGGVPHAHRRRPPVRLRALRAPARPAAVRPLALGAVARRDHGRRRLAPLAPAGGPRPAPARGRVRTPAVRPAGAGAGAAHGPRRPPPRRGGTP